MPTAHFDLSEFFDTVTGDDRYVADLQQWVERVAGHIAQDPNVQAAWTGGDDATFDTTFCRELEAAIHLCLGNNTLPSKYLLLVDGLVVGMVEAARAATVAWMSATFAYADAT